VQRFKAADAILIVTPEYNSFVLGVLKKAADWASCPCDDSAWDEKPLNIMDATLGTLGTAWAQYHLRQMFDFLNMFPLNQSDVFLPQ